MKFLVISISLSENFISIVVILTIIAILYSVISNVTGNYMQAYQHNLLEDYIIKLSKPKLALYSEITWLSASEGF